MSQITSICLIVFILSAAMPQPISAQYAARQAQQSISITTQKTSVLIFPAAVEAVDMGSADILVRPFLKGSPVLKVKAAKPDFIPTNLTILTKDGHLFSINVKYDSVPSQQVYYYERRMDSIAGTTPGIPVSREWLDIEKAAEVAAARPSGCYKRHRQFRMVTQLRNILFKDDLLFFAFEITNNSQIPYDVAFLRSYQRDRQQRKRSSQTEKEITPVHQYFSTGKRIPGESRAVLVLVFNKFTIADHKQVAIELYEQEGDRVLRLTILGEALLRADTW